MSKTRGILFYSNKDKGHSSELITRLRKHDLIKMFNLCLIDDWDIAKIEKYISNEIPALRIESENGKFQQFEGKEAFDWVDGLIMSHNSNIKNAESSRKLIQNTNTKEKLLHRLFEHCPEEHSGISDKYAYYNEKDEKDNTLAQSKTFSYNLKSQNDNIGAVPIAGGNIKEYKKKESLNAVYGDLTKTLSQIETDRHKQTETFKKNMEKETLAILANRISKN